MMVAEISPVNFFLVPFVTVAFLAAVIGILTGIVLAVRKQTRKIGQKVLLVAMVFMAIDIGLMIIAAMIDSA